MKRRIICVAVVMVLSSFVLGNSSAWARERARTGTYQGKKTSGTWEQKTLRNPGQVNKDTVKTATGKTTSRSGTATVQSAYTGAEGKSLNVQKAVEKTENGRVVSGTYTSSAGKTGTFNSDVDRGGGNTITRKTAVTDLKGQQHDSEESATIDEPTDE